MNACVLNLLSPTKNGYAFLVSTAYLTQNLSMFFEELTIYLSKVILKYDNLLVMGYFNLEVKSKSLAYDQLDEFCDLFNLINFIKLETCFTKNCIFYLDLFLINTTLSVQITHVMRPV